MAGFPIDFFSGQSSRSPGRLPGFTLLEVLVATVILAICLTVIMELFSGALQSDYLSKKYVHAVFLAREKMDQILVLRQLSESTFEGKDDDGFRWKTEIHPMVNAEEELPKLPFDTFEIRVEVMWGEAGHQRSYKIHTLQLVRRAEG